MISKYWKKSNPNFHKGFLLFYFFASTFFTSIVPAPETAIYKKLVPPLLLLDIFFNAIIVAKPTFVKSMIFFNEAPIPNSMISINTKQL